MDKIQVDILGISSSPSNAGAYALILKELHGNRRLPIIIGAFEAQAIALELEGMKPPRPLTHDLMKTIIEGVLAGQLPWQLVLGGAGLSIGAILCGVSGLAFAIGVYLPLASMAPLFVGGCARALYERGRKPSGESDPGVLAASGLVAGEAIAGVLLATCVSQGWVPKDGKLLLTGIPGELGACALVLLVCGFLYSARGVSLAK